MFKSIQDRIDNEIEKDGVVNHYRLMLFFLFCRFDGANRFEGKMYFKMRRYFARHLVNLLNGFMVSDWRGKMVLDVGGATGDFCDYISANTGARCVNLDPDADKISRTNFRPSIMGDALHLGIADKSFDVVLSRGVIEHCPRTGHRKFVQECFRVLKPGGMGYLTSSPWFAPWAGHQLAPFHYLPIKTACLLANLVYGTKYHYNSYAEADLYYLSFDGFRKMLREAGFEVKYVEDPLTRLDFLARIPIFRELLIQHMAFVVQRPLNS